MRATPNRRGQPQRERPAGRLDLPCRVTGRSSSEQEAAKSVRGTGEGHPGSWHHRGDEQVKFPSLSCDRHPVSAYALPDLQRTVAYRPGKISEVLTEHYRRADPETLGLSSR
jgi:hypothetical protein